MKTLSVIFTLLLGLGIASADTGNLSNMRFAGVWFYRTQDEQAVAGQFPVGHLYGGRRESVEDSVQMMRMIKKAWKQLVRILSKIFPDMEEDDWNNVSLKELLPVLILILWDSFKGMMTIPKSKNE